MEALWFWKPAPHGLAGSSPADSTIFLQSRGPARSGRLPVTEKTASSNLVGTANFTEEVTALG